MRDDYELLDSGDGRKLERFGKYVLARPCSQAMWRPALPSSQWRSADASFDREDGNRWHGRTNLPGEWRIETAGIRFKLGGTDFGHLGIFPEQRAQWRWIKDRTSAARPSGLKALNLFAYSGGATLAAAAGGAEVYHVDASKGMVSWAKENAAACKLSDAPVRWLVDDCIKFVQREIRRGNKYDIIIMDPPSYGRGPGGEVWKLENEVYGFVELCSELLTEDSLMVLINSYTTGLSPSVMEYILGETVQKQFGGSTTSDEIGIPVSSKPGRVLPCGASAIWLGKGVK